MKPVAKRFGHRLLIVPAVGLLVVVSAFTFSPLVAAQSSAALCIVSLDCQPPGSPTIASPENASFESLSNFDVAWNGVSDSSGPVTYTVCVANSSSFSNATCGDTQATSGKVAEIIGVNPLDGLLYWRVMATDTVGNKSDWSDNTSVTVDTVAPTIQFTSSRNNIGGSNPVAILTASAFDDAIAGCNLMIYDSTNNLVASANCAGDGTINFEWNASSLTSATYNAVFSASDQAGNVSNQLIPIAVDNSGPTVTVGGSGVLISGGGVTPDVSASDAHQANLTYQWTADAGNPGSIDYNAAMAEPTFTPDIQGSYTFFLRVIDDFGNVSSVKSFSVDYFVTLAPIVIPDTTIPNTDVIVTSTPTNSVVTVDGASSRAAASIAGRSANDETGQANSAIASTLGLSTTALSAREAAKDASPIVATHQGWQILGILWYWWVLLVAVLGFIIVLIKRVTKRVIITS